MKKIIFLLLFPALAFAQVQVSDTTIGTKINTYKNLSSTYTNEKSKIVNIFNLLNHSKPNILLSPGKIFVGNGSGVASPFTMGGDGLMSSLGNLTVTGLRGIPLSSTAPTTNQILQYNGSQWVPAAVTTSGFIRSDGTIPLTANWDLGGFQLKNLVDPTSDQDAATKAYVDAIAAGLTKRTAVYLATTDTLPANVYNNGASGVGATLTAVLPDTLKVDGIIPPLNARLLIKDEADKTHNGIYTLTTFGTIAVSYVLTRATDYDQGSELPNALAIVSAGNINSTTQWVIIGSSFTIGTTPIYWSPIGQTFVAGQGIDITANTISVKTTQNITTLSNLTTKGIVTTTAAGLLGSQHGTGFLRDDGAGNITYDPATYLTSYTETDPIVAAINGIVKSNGSTISAAVSGTDYAPATSGTSILKGNGSGGFSNASAGTDYQAVLISGTNIKTVNSGSLLGSGNLAVGDALVANPLSQFASTTSAQLRTVLSDESGTAEALFGGATPSALTLTNATGLPLTSGVTGLLPLANGGTNANLTASNGGIVWSNSTQLQILSGTATANKMLLSGATATPSWSTSTIPSSAGSTANKALISDGTNYVLAGVVEPNSATTGDIQYASSSNVYSNLAANSTGTKKYLQSVSSGVPSWAQVDFADLSSQSNAWLSASGSTLTGANTITGTTSNTLTAVFNSLGTTLTNGAGLWLQNSTAATNGNQQNSPYLTLEGQGWGTSGGASQSVKLMFATTPTQGTAALPGLTLYQSIGGAAYSQLVAFNKTSAGNFQIQGGTSTVVLSANGQNATALSYTQSLFTTNVQTISSFSFSGSGTQSVFSGSNQAVGGFVSAGLTQSQFTANPSSVTNGIINNTGTWAGTATNGTYTSVSAVGGTGSGAKATIVVSSGTVQASSTFPSGTRGSGYSVGDVLTFTITGGVGVQFTIGAGGVDFSGNIVGFLDNPSITDAKSIYAYESFKSTPTWNISSTQVGALYAVHYVGTHTNLGSFQQGNFVYENTGSTGGIGNTLTNMKSTWDVGASFGVAITTSTGSLTLDATHHTVIITSGTGSYTLPSASGATRREYIIVNQTGGARTISSYKDKTGASQTTIASGASATLQSDGSNWYQIN